MSRNSGNVQLPSKTKYSPGGFTNFAAAANVVKHFRSLRILQIAPRPAEFWTMICNEGELLEKFGIEIHPITLEDIKRATLKEEKSDSPELQNAIDYIKQHLDWSEVKEEDVRRVAALKVALKNYAVDTGSSAIAIHCWSSLQDGLSLEPLIDKWRAFGWEVEEVDGNDVGQLRDLLRTVPFKSGKPSLVIANTVKGKGVSLAENVAGWHHHVPTKEEYEQVMKELSEEWQVLQHV